MADHADDTILDDELDENDYNFDNENEDDLLADNDDWLEKSKSTMAETASNRVELPGLDEDKIIEQSEAEEDVLDIGLVDEDVDPELQDATVIYSQVKSEPVKRILEKPLETRESAVSKDTNELASEDRLQKSETPSETVPSSNIDIPTTVTNKNSYSSHEDDQDDDERTFKAKVISLRKSVKKSYDDLPELAKVIPGFGTSRNNKFQRSNDTHISRKEVSTKHAYDYDDKKKRELIRHGRDRDRDRDHDWERDQSRDRSRDRYRDRSYDRDRSKSRSRSRDREYSRSSDYRDKYYSSDDDRSPSPFRGSIDRHSDVLAHSYQNIDVQSENRFQNAPNHYPPSGVQMTQDRYNFQVMRPNLPPQPQNQMHQFNSFGSPNHAFNRPPPPQMEHMMRHPPPGAQRMPSQPVGFPPEHRMQPPPHQPGFRPPPPQMNQRFPPNLPPHLQPRGPPMHAQPPSFNGPSQPQMPPQQMIRQPGLPPQMQPPFRPPGNHLRPPPPQPMCGPMEHMRPAPHPNMRPMMMRLPVPNEQQPPSSIMGHAPPRPMAHPNNFPPPNNVVRMAPPFRPHHVSPPQNVTTRPPPYYNEQPQFHGATPPTTPYSQGQQHINEAPQYPNGAPGQPMQPIPVNNRPGGEMYHNASNRSEANYSQYPQQNYLQQSARQYQEYPPYGTSNLQNVPQKRMNSSPSESPSKFSRYDEISGRRDSEDDDMKVYREKVEHQKKIREKYIQEKEEQRLKNQMQSFIQNNIKGILEKREQLMRKSELEQSKQLRETPKEASRIVDSKRSDESRRNDSLDYRSRRSVSPTRKNVEPTRRSVSPARRNMEAARRSFSPVRRNVDATRVRDRDRTRDVVSKERPKMVSGRTEDSHRAPRIEKRDKHEDTMSDSERKQLHKLSRITYKDGTVALKCIPVHNNNNVASKSNVTSSRKNDEDSNNTNTNRRRMVVSKQIPLLNVKNELNENTIVESVRTGVTQSSMTLAKRFSNLKVMNKNAEEDESLSVAKSKNRLVIPDEDGTRTVLVKNVSANTSPAVLQKMISTCGTVSRTNWIYNGGHLPNNVKITFCRTEDAKKFCQNFHKKTVDTSIITVSLCSDMK